MKRVASLSIAAKIYAVVGFLSVVAGVIGWLGVDAMQRYDAQVREIRAASERAVVGERINGLINAVVMDSRGIYMARDRAEAEKFAKPLLGNLKLMKDDIAGWVALLPERHPAGD